MGGRGHAPTAGGLELGGNLAALKQIVGHAWIDTTQRCARLSDEVVLPEAKRVGSAAVELR